ncbi:hypothetical protein FHS15_005430 [Paenibacillus castaneae]|nr:hypothetical protein [Paenibacillus castaneae]
MIDCVEPIEVNKLRSLTLHFVMSEALANNEIGMKAITE